MKKKKGKNITTRHKDFQIIISLFVLSLVFILPRLCAADLSADHDVGLHQDRPPSLLSSSAGELDFFGKALAVGNFDGTGGADLVVGIPGEDDNHGAVEIFYGIDRSRDDCYDDFCFAQWRTTLLDHYNTDIIIDPGDNFGQALAVGDFDGNGVDDLAVGAPNADSGAFRYGNEVRDHGVVHIFYGQRHAGISYGRRLFEEPQFFDQLMDNVGDTREQRDRFGWALAAGDFNGDGYDDLAVGVPYEDIFDKIDVGTVHILYGSEDGLCSAESPRSQIWHQSVPGFLRVIVPPWLTSGPTWHMLGEEAESFDWFGRTLAVGYFNDDEYADLAIGVPYEDLGVGKERAGAVHVIYGSRNRLGSTSSPASQIWHQDIIEGWDGWAVQGVAENRDRFGYALAAGDFDGNGTDDLAVGVPWETVNGHNAAGAVSVLYSDDLGLTAWKNALWHQDRSSSGIDIEATANAYDYFGWALTAGDFDGSGTDDLAVGVRGDSVSGRDNAGVVNVLYSNAVGLNTVDNQLWHQDRGGIEFRAWSNDTFGWALIAGDFDNNGADDLAVGVPGKRVSGHAKAGVVNVLYAE
jgi:hypothetical protein